MKINSKGAFKMTHQRAHLREERNRQTGDMERKGISYVTIFSNGKYELIFRVETFENDSPYVYAECKILKGNRYTPQIYIYGDEGVFGSDENRPMEVVIQTTSYGTLKPNELDEMLAELNDARTLADVIMDDFIKPILDAGNDLSETGLLLQSPKGYAVGDSVNTPRFLHVKLKDVYASEEMMQAAGYTEPTHYHKDGMSILGQNIGDNRMEFAAAPEATR